jgi:hypothetical protein
MLPSDIEADCALEEAYINTESKAFGQTVIELSRFDAHDIRSGNDLLVAEYHIAHDLYRDVDGYTNTLFRSRMGVEREPPS